MFRRGFKNIICKIQVHAPSRKDVIFILKNRLSKFRNSDFNSQLTTNIFRVALITFVTCDIFSRKLLLLNSCLIILLNKVMKLLKSLTNI